MSIEQDLDLPDEDEYDEEADSDFEEDGANGDDISSPSEDDENTEQAKRKSKPRLNSDLESQQDNLALELDSGDEVTIKERKKTIKRQKRKGEDFDVESGDENLAWRAKTRSMREHEKEEQKRNKLAKIEGATIDVDKAWEEMNRLGPLPPIRLDGSESVKAAVPLDPGAEMGQDKEEKPALASEEMITIKRKFKFAGEVHTEEKIVPKSSAEARLWLAQQESKSQAAEEVMGIAIQRPLRKISRFDPNYHNIEAFKMNWARTGGAVEAFKGPKLNVVEKSKMDWASHVDAEGLKDELDEHAKAKEGYHNRMEFLNQVEQRKEEEARQARIKK